MTDLRKAAEMALEALEDIFGKEKKDVGAINALRQALAQPEQEPYPEGDIVGPCICGSWPGGECLKCKRIEQPKREWVGLTDADKQEAFDETQEAGGGFWEFADYLDAKLKEKNQ